MNKKPTEIRRLYKRTKKQIDVLKAELHSFYESPELAELPEAEGLKQMALNQINSIDSDLVKVVYSEGANRK